MFLKLCNCCLNVRILTHNRDSSPYSVLESFEGDLKKLEDSPYLKILTYLALGGPQGINNFKKNPTASKV